MKQKAIRIVSLFMFIVLVLVCAVTASTKCVKAAAPNTLYREASEQFDEYYIANAKIPVIPSPESRGKKDVVDTAPGLDNEIGDESTTLIHLDDIELPLANQDLDRSYNMLYFLIPIAILIAIYSFRNIRKRQ